LLDLDYPAYEILVIDDGSTDDTYARAAELEGRHGDVVIRVVSKTNGGKAKALNTGIAIARHPFVVCMDGDSRLDRDTLSAAMRHFADPKVGAVAGNVKVVNRDTLWTRLQALEYIEGLNMARRAQGFLRVVNIIPGPIGVFRRETLTGVGGYDSDTFAEDADLTLKILTAGWHIVYEDRAIAYTEAPESLLDLIKQRYRWTRGILQALRKRGRWLAVPRGGFSVWLSLLAMLFEAVIWPVMNVAGNLFFVGAALAAGATDFVVYWWILLTLLDVSAALHTVAMEEEDLSLVPYAVVYRLFFVVLIDVAKLFATVEELFRVRMSWGKLERAGRI
jgi:cellulose synthase/poly-beta-1,6-N-acetylglucosamine synthase-like glycosyltransferase